LLRINKSNQQADFQTTAAGPRLLDPEPVSSGGEASGCGGGVPAAGRGDEDIAATEKIEK